MGGRKVLDLADSWLWRMMTRTACSIGRGNPRALGVRKLQTSTYLFPAALL